MGMMLVDMRSRNDARPEPSYQYIGQAKGDAATDNEAEEVLTRIGEQDG